MYLYQYAHSYFYKNGKTALYAAAYQGDRDIVHLLISRGAEMNTPCEVR